ncbi:hypothetical protein [Paraburkholderia aromaticivorans]|uniref:hypothetical protein n=1 Tax=Paraburkholderia aromaticivorans TaxID=2026199 RepID=UPI001455DCCF|nr:hypothetical protein [Paraburkholderia aromaticivorans]
MERPASESAHVPELRVPVLLTRAPEMVGRGCGLWRMAQFPGQFRPFDINA